MNKKEKEQKEKELITLKHFLRLKIVGFDDEKINLTPEEPSDLDYDGQGYQITTLSGKRFGEIMSATNKFDLNDIKDRTTTRTCKTDDVVKEDLEPILTKKVESADNKIILLLALITADPFTNEEREKRYKNYAKLNRNLVDKWKEVYCVCEINNQLIQLH